MPTHTFAIGDIHGCSAALDAPRRRFEDTVFALADDIDQAPDRWGVLDRLIEMGRRWT